MRPVSPPPDGQRTRGAEFIDATAGHGLTTTDTWAPGLVFLRVEVESLAIGSGHRPFR
jgi:hypothetical protein